jgi:hypothetical protein
VRVDHRLPDQSSVKCWIAGRAAVDAVSLVAVGDEGGLMTDADHSEQISDLLASLSAELDATAELPVSPRASPWLGEAAAVAADAADAATEGVDDAYLAERVGHVRRLLDGAGETGNARADAHVEAAADLAEEAAARLPDADE